MRACRAPARTSGTQIPLKRRRAGPDLGLLLLHLKSSPLFTLPWGRECPSSLRSSKLPLTCPALREEPLVGKARFAERASSKLLWAPLTRLACVTGSGFSRFRSRIPRTQAFGVARAVSATAPSSLGRERGASLWPGAPLPAGCGGGKQEGRRRGRGCGRERGRGD